jgi:MFS-type transporter involved in bile tolerance (Atg22 family)
LTSKYIYFQLTFYFSPFFLTRKQHNATNTKSAIGESAKQLVGLSGIFIGVGEVSGGVAFGLLGSKITTKLGRDPIVILGFVVHVLAFFLIFLNLPNYANLGDTTDIGKFSLAASSPLFGV